MAPEKQTTKLYIWKKFLLTKFLKTKIILLENVTINEKLIFLIKVKFYTIEFHFMSIKLNVLSALYTWLFIRYSSNVSLNLLGLNEWFIFSLSILI